MSLIAELMENITPLIGLAGTLFWIWMLIDCFNRAKARPYRVWLFILLLFSTWVGALIYFFVFVFPLSKLVQTPSQPMQKKPFTYYTPSRPPSYQHYQQGYQSQSASTSASYSQENQQSYYPTSDYEEPHATYPEMPPQQQQ